MVTIVNNDVRVGFCIYFRVFNDHKKMEKLFPSSFGAELEYKAGKLFVTSSDVFS